MQERATLRSLQSELGRQEIAARQAARAKQRWTCWPCATPRRARPDARGGAVRRRGSSTSVDRAGEGRPRGGRPRAQERTPDRGAREREPGLEVHNRRLAVARQHSVVTELQRQVAGSRNRGAVRRHGRHRERAGPGRGGREPPVLTVVNLSAFEIEIDMPENYASESAPGTPAEILYEGKTYPGQVTRSRPRSATARCAGRSCSTADAARPAPEPARRACACCSSARRTC